MVSSITVKGFGLRAYDFAIAGPARAAWEFGSQAAITSASVAMNAGFAQSHGILDPTFAWIQAIGFEWTYLRGLATAGKTKSRWVDALNLIAFVSVVLYGVMFCLVQYKVVPETPGPGLAFFLSLVHVVPIGLTGLCAAMIHRAVKQQEAAAIDTAAQAERTRQTELQRQRDAMDLEDERKRRDLQVWKEAQELKRAMKGAPVAAVARPSCPECGGELSGSDFALYKSAQARSVRFKGCAACRSK